MTSLRVAAVQAAYVLMDQAATLDRVGALTAGAAGQGAQLVAFPEVFVPGTPVWIDTRPIWDGDEDWSRLLAEGPSTVWGMGDGSTLGVVDTPFGRVGGLICWGKTAPGWSEATPR